MTLFTDLVYLTTDIEGFRNCRETRSESGMTILLCQAGHIDVFYKGQMIRVEKDDLLVRLNAHDIVLGPYEYSEDFQFCQFTIDAKIFDQIMYDHIRVEPNWYAKQEYIKDHPIFRLYARSRDFFLTYFHLFELQLRDDKITDYRIQIMNTLAKAATMEMLNYLDKLAVIDSNKSRLSVNQSDYTFREFMKLLQQYPHEREVQWYANQLNITPKYLSEICKDRSGKSASQWIADITVAELRHLLRDTTMPIRDIARLMEFPNASFFCQYTKRHTGLTPNHFRKEKKA